MQDAIIGHQQILEQLHHAIASNRIAGAYLFVGLPMSEKRRWRFILQSRLIVLRPAREPVAPVYPAVKLTMGIIRTFRLFVHRGLGSRLIRSVNCRNGLFIDRLKVPEKSIS